MQREWNEETGLWNPVWEPGVIVSEEPSKAVFFRATVGSKGFFDSARSGKRWLVCAVDDLPQNVLPGLRWMIPLFRDSEVILPVQVFVEKV